ncbi:hypothetical protein OROMI_027119 [Orobanche minor]
MTKLDTIFKLRNQLCKEDPDFLKNFENDNNITHLAALLKFSYSQILTKVNLIIMKHYDTKDRLFKINGVQLGISLEDALYMTGLPIKGKLVICAQFRDPDAFQRVFGISGTSSSINAMKQIVLTKERHIDVRKKALLLILIHSFVTSEGKGGFCPIFVQFVDNLQAVNTYAWGAALLSFLYYHLQKNKGKGVIGENMWLTLSFFLI